MSRSATLSTAQDAAGHFALTGFLLSIVVGTAIAALGGSELRIFGKNLCGYVWVTQALAMGLVVLACRRRKPAFPFWLWAPWLAYVVIQCDWFIFAAAQRTFMLILAPAVAWTASGVLGRRELEWLLRALTPLALILIVLFVVSSLGLLPSGVGHQGCAAGMTLAFCAAYFAPGLYAGKWKHTVMWLLCVATCPLSGMRTLTAVAILTPLLPAMRLGVRKRLVAACVCGLLGLVAASLPSIQREMSATGEPVSAMDVLEGKEKLYTSGRETMWPMYLEEASKNPIWGAGGDACGRFISWGGHHPHNDYIRVFFDYGLVGLVLFCVPFGYCTWDLWRRCRREKDSLVCDALSVSFCGMVMFLLLAITDNVILYIQFYGCLLFCIMGAAYQLSSRQSGTTGTVAPRSVLQRPAAPGAQ